ncbi:MAG: TolC family protein [Clostridiales Family XIII bacterium]|jgi:hypothetical protein|nr:TolC family protein [Clostridiales Family XIII bacterium]
MDKRFTSLILALLVMAAGAVPAFAADETAVGAVAYDIAPNMEFSGTPVALSLNEAVKRATSEGPGYESAVLKKETFEAQALAQEDTWASWESISKAMSANPARYAMQVNPLKSLDAKVVKMTRPYLLTQAAIQYQMDVNMLGYEATQAYYAVTQAEEAVRIAKENLQNQKNILSNTNKKFELGVVSKMDVLKAESAAQDASVQEASAVTRLKTQKMAFNQKLNYPLMQEVKLTDELKRSTGAAVYLKDSIESALNSRNELNQQQYVLDKANLTLADKGSVSRYSAEYLTALLDVRQAEKSLKDTKLLIEMDIRARFLTIQNIQEEITALEKTVSNAKEGFRLAELSYNAGMNTLVDVQSAQVASFNAQQGLSAKILEYNLALSDLAMAVGYGKPQTGA